MKLLNKETLFIVFIAVLLVIRPDAWGSDYSKYLSDLDLSWRGFDYTYTKYSSPLFYLISLIVQHKLLAPLVAIFLIQLGAVWFVVLMSKNIGESLAAALFVLLSGFIVFEMNTLRQALAVSFVSYVATLPKIRLKNYMVLFSSLIHYSVVFSIALHFMVNNKNAILKASLVFIMTFTLLLFYYYDVFSLVYQYSALVRKRAELGLLVEDSARIKFGLGLYSTLLLYLITVVMSSICRLNLPYKRFFSISSHLYVIFLVLGIYSELFMRISKVFILMFYFYAWKSITFSLSPRILFASLLLMYSILSFLFGLNNIMAV